jgi:uncharacterized protein
VRNILILILVVIGIWWLRRALGNFNSGRATRRRDKAAAKGQAPERMLACRHCGVHVPESEGVRQGADFYCCEEHRRLGAGPG